MFKINPDPTFNTDVSIPTPGGESTKLPIVFKHKKHSELKKLTEAVVKNNESNTSDKNVDLLYACIESWDADQPFNKKNFEALLENYPMAFNAIYAAFFSAYYEAKAGN